MGDEKNDYDALKAKIDKAETSNKLPFINAHTHIFNFDHVNNHFLKGMIPWWVTVLLSIVFVSIVYLIYFLIIKVCNWGFWQIPVYYVNYLRFLISAFLVILFVSFILAPIYFILYISYCQPSLNWLLKRAYFKKLIVTLRNLIPGRFDMLERYTNLILHSYDFSENRVKSQKEIFAELQSYYPKHTKFVVLSMDLDYMVNCNKPNGKTFYDQLQELELLKGQFDEIFPFIHTDPRRLVDKDQNYLDTVKKYIENGVFNGFKIYPANGYFPFDIRLKPIYDLALKFNLPITTHCSIGPVYYRGKLSTFRNDGYFENGRFIHPFTGNELMGNNGKEFSPHFTHPLNYYCLMNEPDSLFRYWKKCEKILDFIPEKDYTIDDLKEYRKLKFCLGHFGGSEEWEKYLNDPWLPSRKNSLTIDEDLIHLSKAKWVHMIKGTDIDKLKPNSWHSIISDMIGKKDENGECYFPYLYSDISYNLSNDDILPLLKVRLETDDALSEKILFGTDFFMVSTKATERKITMNVRSYLGEDNFKKIAKRNPTNFLASKITDVSKIINK